MTVPTEYTALSTYLGDHVKAEEQALQAYHDLLKDRTDDLATYLVKMIVSDERRHHQMFADMQRTLESYMHWRDIEPHVPPIRITGDTNALLRATEELLRLEKADAKELRRLRRSWHRATGERKLWALLVSTAEIDTKNTYAFSATYAHYSNDAPADERGTGRDQGPYRGSSIGEMISLERL